MPLSCQFLTAQSEHSVYYPIVILYLIGIPLELAVYISGHHYQIESQSSQNVSYKPALIRKDENKSE